MWIPCPSKPIHRHQNHPSITLWTRDMEKNINVGHGGGHLGFSPLLLGWWPITKVFKPIAFFPLDINSDLVSSQCTLSRMRMLKNKEKKHNLPEKIWISRWTLTCRHGYNKGYPRNFISQNDNMWQVLYAYMHDLYGCGWILAKF